MIDSRFEKFWLKLKKYEGGYVNDPNDPGGETKYGISNKSYPDIDIKNLTEQQAKEIYLRDYYIPMMIPEIVDDRLAWQVFDFGVNAGKYVSIKTLQRIVGAVPDGVLGNKTLNKINLFEDEYPLWVHFMSKRYMYYFILTERNHKMIKFLKGWILRTAEL